MRFAVVALVVVAIIAALYSSGGSAALIGETSTIAALQTRVAELEGTVSARGQKINKQRTQIAELKNPQPTATQASGNATGSFEGWTITVLSVEMRDSVGDQSDPEVSLGTYMVLNLEITNDGNVPEDFPSHDLVLVVDEKGAYSYNIKATIALFVYELDGGFIEDIQPGLPTPQTIVFDVPSNGKTFVLTNQDVDFKIDIVLPS